MCFSYQKKELINLKHTLNELRNKDSYEWIQDFSIVKLVSIWEQIIRKLSDTSLSEIESNSNIKVSFDKKRFYEFVWKSWLDNKQPHLFNEKITLQIKNIKRHSEVRNKVAHGYVLIDNDKKIISTIGDDDGLLDKTLNILEEL